MYIKTEILKRLPYPVSGENYPKLIVVHAMAEYILMDNGEILHAYDLLKKIKLSAHRLITPGGITIVCREDSEKAWHAKGYNTNSLGIEILVPGVYDYEGFVYTMENDEEWWTKKQVSKAIKEVEIWKDRYNLSNSQIKMHCEIDPQRKVDPGKYFPIDLFR